MKDIGVVGAGASGLMAAGRAAERGHRVFVFEKNKIAGKKIRITGNGRCNLTNACDWDTLISNIPGNGKFLYSSLSLFSNKDIMDFFIKMGLDLKIERDNRVFPKSDRARDVVDALLKYASMHNVRFLFESRVEEILTKNGCVSGVRLSDGTEKSLDAVIVATGGVTYPGTGSTGDGHSMVRKLGHTITPLRPSLVPLLVKESWVRKLQGLSLKDVSVEFLDRKGSRIYNARGEMMFTHFGVTGPVILSASRHILEYGCRDIFLRMDLFPDLTEEGLDIRIQNDFQENPRKMFKNSLNKLLPSLLVPVIAELSGILPEKSANQVTRNERQRLVNLLKNLKCEITGSRSFDEAVVTAGGVCVKEINPRTMESKLIKGLYFAGEIMDVDAYTGGFNLTIAFSTGYVAGNSV
ncbi:flavoprotein [Thermoclostridium stercorarium subsp. stercorarium DSM 8532]|uniref:Flavoprotein n=2 Tax=Thermoclostridium stercorarium TaxID=1510 RepID=L7VNZ3_THES1|nr:NAD(P)/FAD-dependent oxidoreductase [Thermoclostridium stercorarium]AGC68502.1 flavoprotein [Thermoclostridium stercorarium subsp. stercorarium DSM 8532]AGI39520.1 flavoprotein [Thermoclostridium stercorarium subsp. stercorarium DSM 8532]ANW98861.1 FAD-dependent oxidoreductase [Thermoclostridium stercorarium subsp. thermolacticum DSM 2910]